MKKLTALVDMGASMTKYGVDGEVENASLPNNIVIRDTPSTVYKMSDNRLDNFEIFITTEDDKKDTPVEKILNKYISFGMYATRGSDTSIRPSMDDKKCSQPLNYASIIATLAYEAERGNLWGKVRVALAVPPIEIKQAREAFKALIGTYTVRLVGGGRLADDEHTVEIDEVVCFEEPLLTAMAFMFSKRGPKHPELLGKTLLFFDIGASTTDLGIFKGKSYQDNSQKTIRIGCNIVRDTLKDAIYEKYEVLLDVEDLDAAIRTGVIEICGTKENIVGILDDVRCRCAAKIRAELTTYFKDKNVDIKTLGGLVFSGGGSLSAEGEDVEDSKSVGYFIGELFPGIPCYYFGENARFANVEGLATCVMFFDKN